MPTVHLTITGKVQGVFYRASAKEKATELDLKGWVKNTPGHQVEIIAHGTAERLQELIEWCKRGPSNARVEDVTSETIADQQFYDFKIIR